MPKFSIFLELFSNSNENERFPTLSEEELANLGSKNQNQNISKSTRSEARNFDDIPRHELRRCNSLSFFDEIRKEDGDEYEPDSGKENARFKKLLNSLGHFVYEFHRSMQYFHAVASFANSGE